MSLRLPSLLYAPYGSLLPAAAQPQAERRLQPSSVVAEARLRASAQVQQLDVEHAPRCAPYLPIWIRCVESVVLFGRRKGDSRTALRSAYHGHA